MRLLTESKTVLTTIATGKYIEPQHNNNNENNKLNDD